MFIKRSAMNNYQQPPKTAKEHRWMSEHQAQLKWAKDNGKCPMCKRELDEVNWLIDLGYQYGMECCWCR